MILTNILNIMEIIIFCINNLLLPNGTQFFIIIISNWYKRALTVFIGVDNAWIRNKGKQQCTITTKYMYSYKDTSILIMRIMRYLFLNNMTSYRLWLHNNIKLMLSQSKNE